MRWGLHKRSDSHWEVCFAWYPVTAKTVNGDLVTVWFEKVYFRWIPGYLGESVITYRVIENIPSKEDYV